VAADAVVAAAEAAVVAVGKMTFPREMWSALGIGWRPELAWFIERQPDISFIEVLYESVVSRKDEDSILRAIDKQRECGRQVVIHGTTLSLGGAMAPDARRLEYLARLAQRLDAVWVSEHVAFVRAGQLESGHLLPVQRTGDSLEVVVENVVIAQKALPVPLALENVAMLFQWPDEEMTEAQFLSAVIRQSGAYLLLDVANLYANCLNHGWNIDEFLDTIPLDRVAYMHVAGGVQINSHYHDTHAHDLSFGVLSVLGKVCSRVPGASVLLERDDHWPTEEELTRELKAIADTMKLHSTVPKGAELQHAQ